MASGFGGNNILSVPNSRTPPIDHLSPEILSEIFRLLRRIPKDRDQTWLSLLHVCGRWRAVARSDPALWLDVVTENLGLQDFMLTHSQQLEVKISPFRIVRNQTPAAEALLDKHIIHTRELDLFLTTFQEAQVEYWVSRLLNPTLAPVLHTLRFDISHDTQSSCVARAPRFEIPIRSLSLIGLRVLLPRALPQHHITHLRFDTEDVHPAPWKTDWIFRTLTCLPNLAHLYLRDAAFDPVEGLGKTIALPALMSLAFSGTAEAYLFLSRYLVIPTHTELDVTLQCMDDPDGDETRRLYAHFATHLQRHRDAQAQPPSYEVDCSNSDDDSGVEPYFCHSLVVMQLPRSQDPPPASILQFQLTYAGKFGLRPGIHAYRFLSYLTATLSEDCVEVLQLHSNLLYWETGNRTEGLNSDGSVSNDCKFFSWTSLKSLSVCDPSTTAWITPYLEVGQGSRIYIILFTLTATDP